jgi:aryl-alcohol dehydrogenase-like predicted oxidoreductase
MRVGCKATQVSAPCLGLLQRRGTNQARPAEIALAWLMAREGVTAPIASATSIAQVESFAKAADLSLTRDDVVTLDRASL